MAREHRALDERATKFEIATFAFHREIVASARVFARRREFLRVSRRVLATPSLKLRHLHEVRRRRVRRRAPGLRGRRRRAAATTKGTRSRPGARPRPRSGNRSRRRGGVQQQSAGSAGRFVRERGARARALVASEIVLVRVVVVRPTPRRVIIVLVEKIVAPHVPEIAANARRRLAETPRGRGRPLASLRRVGRRVARSRPFPARTRPELFWRRGATLNRSIRLGCLATRGHVLETQAPRFAASGVAFRAWRARRSRGAARRPRGTMPSRCTSARRADSNPSPEPEAATVARRDRSASPPRPPPRRAAVAPCPFAIGVPASVRFQFRSRRWARAIRIRRRLLRAGVDPLDAASSGSGNAVARSNPGSGVQCVAVYRVTPAYVTSRYGLDVLESLFVAGRRGARDVDDERPDGPALAPRRREYIRSTSW